MPKAKVSVSHTHLWNSTALVMADGNRSLPRNWRAAAKVSAVAALLATGFMSLPGEAVAQDVILGSAGQNYDASAGNRTVGSLSGAAGTTLTLGASVLTTDTTQNTTFAGVISGAGGLIKAGAGALTLVGENTFTGDTQIDGGTIFIGNGGSTGSIVGNITNNGNLTFNRSDEYGYAGIVSGTGGLYKASIGTLTLTGVNTYSGATVISAGTLALGVGGSLNDSIYVNIASAGAKLDISAVNTDVSIKGLMGWNGSEVLLGSNELTIGGFAGLAMYGGVISGAGKVVKEGTLIQYLSGDNTYTGGTKIESGALYIGAGGETGSVIGDVDNKGTLVFNRSNDYTYTGVVSGIGALSKVGAGVLTLTSANTYTGRTEIGKGTLALGIGGSLISSDTVNLNGAGAKFDISAAALQTNVLGLAGIAGTEVVLGSNRLSIGGGSSSTYFGGVISGVGSINKIGSSNLYLTGNNTYTGDTTINSGTLYIGNGSTDGSVSGNVVNNSKLAFARSNDYVYAGVISGTGDLEKYSAGKLTLSGANTYTGNTSVAAGTLAGSLSTIRGNIDVASGALLDLNQTASSTYTGVFTGNGTIALNGSGTTLLTSSSSAFAGSTSLNAGTLLVGNALGAGRLGGSLNVASGATLGGSGTIGSGAGSVVTIASGGILSVGNSIGSLRVEGNLAMSAGSLFNVELGTAAGTQGGPATNDRLVVTGNLTLDGVLNLSQSASGPDGTAGVGYYRLATYGGALLDNGLTIGTTPSIAGGSYSILTNTANAVDLFITSTGDDTLQHWQGGDGTWNSASTQWLNRDGAAPVVWAGNHAVFRNEPGGFNGGTVTVEGAQSFEGLQFVDSGFRLTGTGSLVTAATGSEIRVLADSASIANAITGTGGLTKTEAGTLILSGNNTYTGGTVISAGGLYIGNGGTTGSVAGDIVNNAYLTFNRSNTIGYGGVISGTGSLTKLGAGSLYLTGANTYTGDTVINTGSLYIGNGDTGSVAGNIVNNATLYVNRSNDLSYGGVISGTGSLYKQSTGTLTLTGANTYSGMTAITAGTLAIGAGGSLANTSAVWLLGSAKFDISAANADQSIGSLSGEVGAEVLLGGNTLTVNQSVANIYAGVISGSGGLVKAGTSTLTLTGANTYTGDTVINAGWLQIGNGGSVAGNIVNNATLYVNRSNDLSYGGVISGTGTLYKSGAGTLTLTGSNTYASLTSITAGTLAIGTGGSLANTSGVGLSGTAKFDISGANADQSIGNLSGVAENEVLLGGNTLTVNQTANTTYAGVISGSGGLVKAGTSSLILTDANTYTGDTVINAGSLYIGNGGTTGSVAGNIVNNASLYFSRSNDLSYGGVISGTGNLNKYGAGTLTLTGANTYTGFTAITAGTLAIVAGGSLANASGVGLSGTAKFDISGATADQSIGYLSGVAGNEVLLGGNSLTVNQTANTTYAGVIRGSGSLSNSGAGNLTLSGVNTYTGQTIINSGTIALGAGGSLSDSSIIKLTSRNSTFDISAGSSQNINTLSGVAGSQIILGNNTLTVTSDATSAFSGVISGTGNFVKAGTGALTLSSGNTYTGSTSILGGTLVAMLSSLHGDVILGERGFLNVYQAGTVTFDRVFTGDGAIAFNGNGTTVLTADSSAYAGRTVVHSGTMLIGDALGSGHLGGSLEVKSGATLGGSGTIGSGAGSVVTIASGGILSAGHSIGSLTVDGNLTMTSGSLFNVELGTAAGAQGGTSTNDRVNVTGNLILDGTLNLSQSAHAPDGTVGLGYYRLATYGGSLIDNGLSFGTTPSITGGVYSILTNTANAVDLFIASSGDDTLQHWQGGNGTWSNTSNQWLNLDGLTATSWAGKHAIFRNQPGNFNGGMVAVAGAQSFEGLQFVDNGFSLIGTGSLVTAAAGSEIRVLADSASIANAITGTGGLTKTEAGTLILSGNNTYAGGTVISAGVLSVANNSNLGQASGGITLNGGTLQVTGTTFGTLDRGVTIGTSDGAIDVADANHTLSITSAISGGDLIKRGLGTLSLSGTNTYGNTSVTAGTLAGSLSTIRGNIGVASGARLDLNQTGSSIYAGVFSGNGTIALSGSGTTLLTADSSAFTGSTSLNAGTLLVGNTLGAGHLGGSLNVASGATLGGSGTIGSGAGSVVTIASGGILSAGNSIGTLTINGNLVMSSGTLFNVELGAAGGAQGGSSTNDRVNVTGDLTLDGTLNLSQSAHAPDGTVGIGYYRLATYGGSLVNNGLTIGTKPVVAGADYQILTDSAGSVDLFIAAIGDQTLQHWQGGDGTWSNASNQWLNRDGQVAATWAGEHAIFRHIGGFIGGTITVEGAQSFGGLQFVDNGFRLIGTGSLVTDGTGSEIRVLADSASIATSISGTGGIIKTEDGTLILSGNNTYAGGTRIEGGVLSVANNSNLGQASGGIKLNGGALRVTGTTFGTLDRSVTIGVGGGAIEVADANHTLSITSVISGGDLVKSGLGTLSLSGTNTYGNTNVAAGTLAGSLSSIRGNIGVEADAILDLNQTGSSSYAGVFSGAGDIVFNGAGTTLLTSSSSGFAGHTFLNAGTLLVGDLETFGHLGGSMDVASGATLGGSGVVGSGIGSVVTIASGATLAPGNSIGTLTIQGNLIFNDGARYQVEVNPYGTDSDQVFVSGTATLNGGTVAHIGATGNYSPRSTYTILSAGTLAGSFGSVTSDFAFLNPKLAYNYSEGTVTMELQRNELDFAAVANTRNQIATAKAIESIGLDAANPVFDAIVQMADDRGVIRASFDELSGELHASRRTAQIEDSRFVRNAANDRLRSAFGQISGSNDPVMTYASNGTQPVVDATYDGAAFWAQSFGSFGSFDADAGTMELDRHIGGALLGGDVRLSNWRVGALAGYSQSEVKTQRQKSTSDNSTLGLYAGSQWGKIGLRMAVAQSWHDVDAHRSVQMVGLADYLKADYSATTRQAFVETSYALIARGGSQMEAFANLAGVRARTDGFSETGGSSLLHVAEADANVTFTTLGVRGARQIILGEAVGVLRASAGWRNASGDTSTEELHAFTAGDAFTVVGAPIAKDAAVIETGIDLRFNARTTFGLAYTGQFSDTANDHGFNARMNINF